MSAIYTLSNGDSVTIGGTSSTGPFPKYSLSRSTAKTGDKTKLGNRYNITLTGTILVDSSADVTISGDMQSKLHAKIIQKLQLAMSNKKNIGKLEIVPYGGQPNPIEFLDAELLDVSIPEQPDDGSGVLYSPYTFVFEATEDVSVNQTSIYSHNIENVEESWQISIDEETSYNNPSEIPDRTYTITHSVSATGFKKYTTGPAFVNSGWKEAANWVKSRLVSTPASSILLDVVGDDEFTAFNPELFDSSDNDLSTDISGMGYYNHTRVPNSDILNGTYAVTETWKASNISAVMDMEVSTAIDENENVTMTLSGTITGLDSTSLNNIEIDKLDNAELVLTTLDTEAFSICNTYYDEGGTLNNVVRSKTIGRNKGTGVITFSYSFSDVPILLDNAVSTGLRITDDNEGHLMSILAIIPIISKRNGPIIQDMNTSNEQKRLVNLSAVMRRGYRDTKPAQGQTVALSYAPASAKLTGITEDWEPTTGVYSINVDWTY